MKTNWIKTKINSFLRNKTKNKETLNKNNMEEIDDIGINVDEFIAKQKAKENTLLQQEIPKTTDVIRPPDPMDIKPVPKINDIESKEGDNINEPKNKMRWVKGEKTGTVEEINDDDGEWVSFKSGGRIRKSLQGEYLIVVDSNTPIINIQDELIGMGVNTHTASQIPKTSMEVETKPPSPIFSLLEKSSQTTELEITLKVKVSGPNEGLMNILVDSFGDDAINEVRDYILAQVDTKTLNEAASEQVTKLIQSTKKS